MPYVPTPPPTTVNVPLAYVALPITPTWPISWSNHGVGSGCVVTAKCTALLLFMLGATETTKYPEVAPVGIVVTMDVLPHELIVTGVLFKVTTLLPLEAPKPEPEMTTWLPTEPVVAETPVMRGAGLEEVLTETESNVSVVDPEVLLPYDVANPT